jgi:signal transduction histidine kinase/DNA-binding response OmpR family regulator
MKLRFGIREKFALLAFALVLLAAWALPKLLFQRTHTVVEDHELVDLQDEAELRCWEMMDWVFQLRMQTTQCARDNETAMLERLKSYLTHPPPLPIPSRDADEEDIPEWWDYILSIQVFPANGAPEKLFMHAGMSAPTPPTDDLIAEARKDPGMQRKYPPISSLIVPAEFDPRQRAGAAGGKSAKHRLIPVIWSMQRLQSQPDKVLAILVSLDRGRSPRHLSFMLDEKGGFLMYPFLTEEGKPELVYKDLSLFRECQNLTREHVWGKVGQDADMRVQRSDYPREMQPVIEPLYFNEGALGKKLFAAFDEEYTRDRAGLLKWSDSLRLDLERDGVPFSAVAKSTNQMRLLARSEKDLMAARAKVEAAYRARYPGVPDSVSWNTPVVCAHGDIQFTRFYLRPPQRDSVAGAKMAAAEAPALPEVPYYFVYGAFREELASSISQEMETLRRVALALALLAAIVAFGASLYFFRPLTRIAETAKSVTQGQTDITQLQFQIEKLRKALPVLRTDETGDVARALESLLRQILNSHEQLRQLNADLDNRVTEQTSELREANEQLRGLASAKDAFLASVSHELRQPLNSIFGFLQFLELSELQEEQQHDLGKLRSAATYLRRLIDDILDYQKIIMGGVELDPEDIDASAFLTSMRESMTPQLQERNNEWGLVANDNLGTIHNDRARLQQVLTNLISNACKFTQSGKITLAARRETDATAKDWLIIDVSDTGRGMKPEEMQGLFVRFKKLSAREGNKTGTGLGLVISKGLCELMGGGITCQSEFGKGSTFTVRIPAAVPDKAGGAGRRLTLTPAAALTTLPVPANSQVLVIDDDSAVRELMTRFLVGKGYRVITADDGEHGIEMARKHRPDVITLDVVLPGTLSGWDVLAELKNDPVTSSIPVVIVTFIEETKQGFALGAADYVVKPIAWDGLLTKLKKVTRDSPLTQPVLVVDDDPDVRELFRRTLARDNMTVIEAANGQEAIQVLRTQKPSVILLDLMMPVMDGFEFIAEFNCHPEWMDIPVIVVTAKHITREDRERLAVSTRTILEKSGFTQEDLLGKVLNLVHHHSGGNTK